MRYLYMHILLGMVFVIDVYSQEKVGKGDASYCYDYNQEKRTDLELTDFGNSETDLKGSFSDTLQLSEENESNLESFPLNSGQSLTIREKNFNFNFGYHGSTKLPFGFNCSAGLNYIGKYHAYIRIGFQYNFDRDINHHFGFIASKSEFFIRNQKVTDFLHYEFHKRKLDFVELNNISFNHQFKYGISFKGFGFSTGVNYMIDNNKEVGGVLGFSKRFNKPKIFTSISSSIFKNEFDYRIGISKMINFRTRAIIKGTWIGLYFENFRDYNDLSINITLLL